MAMDLSSLWSHTIFKKHVKLFSWCKQKIRNSCGADRSYQNLKVLRSQSREQWWREKTHQGQKPEVKAQQCKATEVQ